MHRITVRRSAALLFAAALIAVAAVLASAVPAGAAGKDAFTGVWVGIEYPVGDGSTDVLTIGGANAAGVRNFKYYETNASGYCSPGGSGPLTGSGTATSSGDTLAVTFTSATCANGQPGAFPPPFQVTMTATPDGHIDWGGIIFSRNAPVGAQVGRDPFTGVWVGIEVPVGDGSTDVMAISGPNANGVRKFNYYETNASGYCGPGGGGTLTGSGTATSVGETLTVTFTSATCANGQPGAFPPPFQVTMTATPDGHIDWGGIIFSRASTP